MRPRNIHRRFSRRSPVTRRRKNGCSTCCNAPTSNRATTPISRSRRPTSTPCCPAAARRGGAGLQRTAGLLRQPDREINEFRRYPETSARPYYHPTIPQHPARRNSIAGIIVFPDREYNIVFDNSKYNIAPHKTNPTNNTTKHCTDTN